MHPMQRAEASLEKVPEGVVVNSHGWSYPSRSEHGVPPGAEFENTFDVEPRHVKLTAESGSSGVNFNVETVPAALSEHFKKTAINRRELIERLKMTCADHYDIYNMERNTPSRERRWKRVKNEGIVLQPNDIRIEALSKTYGENVVHVGSDGFIMAVVTAFAQVEKKHLPLTLSPDQIWILISYAFAKHVDLNAEALRKNFVQHEGKKRLLVDTPSSFAISHCGNPDSGASSKEWETMVFPDFSRQIKTYIGEKTHAAIAADFTTTNATARAAHEITLMSAMKNYVSYGMSTLCGIPNITLQGTEDDWVALRGRAEELGSLMMPEFSNSWMTVLLPVLDEFVESFRGNVNHGFWQSMVKLRHTAGSGAHSFISGWIQILFPYTASGYSRKLVSWQESYFYGPELEDFPKIGSVAPVDWNYHGAVFDLTFHAGVIGFTQDHVTGALSPLLGWYVSHAPPKPPHLQLKEARDEINALILGHKEEMAGEGCINKSAPWYLRVSHLRSVIETLEYQGAGVE